MKLNTRFEVVSTEGLSIILLLISTPVFSAEDGSSKLKDSSRGPRQTREAAAVICLTKYSERNDRNPTLKVKDDQSLQCHSTQPINWIFNRSLQDREVALPFQIYARVLTCGSWEIPAEANFSSAAPEATSKISSYFASTLTIKNRNPSKTHTFVNIDIFCGTFTPSTKSKSTIFPGAQIELYRYGNFSIKSGKETSERPNSRKCDDLILAHDSTGLCACELTDGVTKDYNQPFFSPCPDLMSRRLWAETRHKSWCEAKSVVNRCNISSFILPENVKTKGGFLYCPSTKPRTFSYTTFFPISQSSTPNAAGWNTETTKSNLTEIQTLGDSVENYEPFLKLSLLDPGNRKQPTRKTGMDIKCRGPAFIFLQGFFWTVESKDKETESHLLPKVKASEPKTETLGDGENVVNYMSSTLTILPDTWNKSTVVTVSCQAFVKDSALRVRSNLFVELQVYKPKILPVVKCEKVIIYHCKSKEEDDKETVTWHNDSGQELTSSGIVFPGFKILETCAENVTCRVTLPNGVSNSHTFTKENCEQVVKEQNCTEISVLDMSTTTKTSDSESTLETTARKTTPDMSTIVSTSSGTVSTDSTTKTVSTGSFDTISSADSPITENTRKDDGPHDISTATENSTATLETTTTPTPVETLTVPSTFSGKTSMSKFTSTSTSIPQTTTTKVTVTPAETTTTETTTSTSSSAAATTTTSRNSPENPADSGQTQTPNTHSTDDAKGKGKAEESGSGALSLEMIIIIAISAILGLCLFILVPCVIILMRKNRKQRERLKMSDEEVNDFLQGNDSVHFLPYDTTLEIPKDKITIGTKVLGSGAFGKVVEGQFGEKRVAIKTVDKSADMQYFKALLSEIKIMGFVGKHENVLELIGACTWDIKKRNVYVVFELCENGNLVQFLRKNRGNFENQLQKLNGAENSNRRVSMSQRCSMLLNSKTTRTSSQKRQGQIESKKMTTRDLVRWSNEIACGMDVIAQKNIYHGDLAARNILLNENLVAKVGDFGLSRQLCEYSVYVQKMACPLPLKWMSIESLRDLEFSIQSDVWSFGITLWEIFSLGCQPYPNAEWNFASWKNLLDGERMEKPDQASNSIYEIMLKCWNEKPTDRPTFAQLKTMFEEEYKKMG